MFLGFFAFVAFVAFVSADSRKEFEAWKLKYAKVYAADEEETRYQNFLASIKIVAHLNERKGGATFGLTKFADMTRSEWKAAYLLPTPITPTPHTVPSSTSGTAPQTVDWRTKGVVTRVKNQEQCGSCWAFSATETIESAWMMAKNIQNTTFKPLGPQQIVDCDDSDDGCNGGNPPTAYQYVITTGGQETEAAYPYTGQDGTCKFQKSKVEATISDWKYACSEEDETTLKENVATKGPLSICVDAANWQYYQGGVMTGWQCAWINLLDHCVQAVGYDMTASTPYWLVRNSWSTDWGEQGYIRLQYGDNTCGLTNEATYVIV